MSLRALVLVCVNKIGFGMQVDAVATRTSFPAPLKASYIAWLRGIGAVVITSSRWSGPACCANITEEVCNDIFSMAMSRQETRWTGRANTCASLPCKAPSMMLRETSN